MKSGEKLILKRLSDFYLNKKWHLMLFLLEFISFPNKENAILSEISHDETELSLYASGSMGLYYDGKCRKTHPNATLNDSEDIDWCSNIPEKGAGKPWIGYELKNKSVKITGYSLRSGCCYYPCCIDDDKILDSECCRNFYSFSLQGSNDNKTWKTIHRVENDKDFMSCLVKTYDIKSQHESYSYIRLVLDEQSPGSSYCMQLNQFEIYGEIGDNTFRQIIIDDESDEYVSIIGKVRK